VAYDIVDKLYKVLNIVSQELTEIQIEHIEELIEHGEWSLALETLCDFIHEDNLRISQQTYEVFEEIGPILELDHKTWEMLKPLVVD